jgi:hypothetical protein
MRSQYDNKYNNNVKKHKMIDLNLKKLTTTKINKFQICFCFSFVIIVIYIYILCVFFF